MARIKVVSPACILVDSKRNSNAQGPINICHITYSVTSPSVKNNIQYRIIGKTAAEIETALSTKTIAEVLAENTVELSLRGVAG